MTQHFGKQLSEFFSNIEYLAASCAAFGRARAFPTGYRFPALCKVLVEYDKVKTGGAHGDQLRTTEMMNMFIDRTLSPTVKRYHVFPSLERISLQREGSSTLDVGGKEWWDRISRQLKESGITLEARGAP